MKKNSKTNKKYNKKMFVIIISFIIIVVFIMLLVHSKNDNKDLENVNYFDTLSPEQKSVISGNLDNLENVYLDTDGMKVNNSYNLFKEIALENGIKIDNILLFASNGSSTLLMNASNKTNKVSSKFKLRVTLLDENKNVIYSFEKQVSQILSNSKIVIEEIVEKDISNAYDIEVKIIK